MYQNEPTEKPKKRQPSMHITGTTHKSQDPRIAKISRLQILEGSSFVSSNGVKGIIYRQGVYCPEKQTFVPFFGKKDGLPTMNLEALNDITRPDETGKTEAFITYSDWTPAKKDWAIQHIRDLKTQGIDPLVINVARIMYRRTFKECHPDYPARPIPKKPKTAWKAPARPLAGSGRPSEQVERVPEPISEILEQMHRDGQRELEEQIARDNEEPLGVDQPPLPMDDSEVPF